MTEKTIENLLKKPIEELGYELVSVSFFKENGEFYLKVIIDQDKNLSLEDIVKVTDRISPLLDEVDITEGNYFLDVTSLGAEKPLKLEKLEKYIQSYVNIHVVNPINGENYIEGTLEEVDSESLTISYKDKTRVKKIIISRANIDKARLAIKF